MEEKLSPSESRQVALRSNLCRLITKTKTGVEEVAYEVGAAVTTSTSQTQRQQRFPYDGKLLPFLMSISTE